MTGLPEFVGIGLSALGTICSIDRPFTDANDFKADVTRWWEPELGTFAPIVCAILARWGRRTGLLTSMGDDEDGRRLRQLLNDRKVSLLFARRTPATGRQIVMTPTDEHIRYSVDRQIQRPALTDAHRAELARLLPGLLNSRWLAADKYETDLLECMRQLPEWAGSSRRPSILFETGSRPRRLTLAAKDAERGVEGCVELDVLPSVDLFTTTWEWIVALTKSAGAIPPDRWRDAADFKAFTIEAETVWPRILPREMPKPYICLVTLSRWGVLAVWRGSTGYEHRLFPAPTVPGTVESRVGAGDIFRAVLIEDLMQQAIDAEALPSLVARGADQLQLIQLAQYGARRWITRKTLPDYFGDFPASYGVLLDEWRQNPLYSRA